MHRTGHRQPVNDVEASITSQIRSRFGCPVRNLRVCVQENNLILSGLAPSYYVKQLVQHIAMNFSQLPLSNQIEVS
ncbi:MAG TPA: hypothetical protein VMV10_03985 [Pirellulales bacterium]|nr:hypothetical protein [Pirellulales bacterium]